MNKISFLLLIFATSVIGFAPTPLVHSPTTTSSLMSKPSIMTRSNTLRQQHTSPLFASSLAVQAAGDDPDVPHKKLGPIVALRATMRKATGLSLTAMYAGCYGFTSGIVRNNMKRVLRVFPTWFRYFLQPFLILYYVPLYMLRTWTSPKKRRERSDLYDDIMLDFKRGVQAADKALDDGYWPIQMSQDGVSASFPPEIAAEELKEDDELKP